MKARLKGFFLLYIVDYMNFSHVVFLIWLFLVGESPSSHTRLTLVPYLTFRFELSHNRDKLAVLWVAYI